jgi:hypothetical protein
MFTNLRIRTIVSATMLAAFAICTLGARAATITTLFNTGLNVPGTATLVGTGVPDPHYTLISSPSGATAVTVNDPGYPIGTWFPNSVTSRWIGPAGNSIDVGGTYIYRTSFFLPANAIPSTVNISGLWGVDDVMKDLLVNGNSTAPVTPFYTPLTPFTVPTGFFIPGGINNLDFVVLNANIGANPTGLRIEGIKGTYQIPEPSTVYLTVVALGMSAGLFRRLRPVSSREAATS